MSQTIDRVRLKAAAEHLEWVLQQYPASTDVQELLHALSPLIGDAKAGRLLKPAERIPCGYNFGDGMYTPYREPNVDEAYVAFSIEMKGGLTEQEERLRADIEAIRS